MTTKVLCNFEEGKSDVHVVYESRVLRCCLCSTAPDTGPDFTAHRYSDMNWHLQEHKKAGDLVPDSVICGLNHNAEELGDKL